MIKTINNIIDLKTLVSLEDCPLEQLTFEDYKEIFNQNIERVFKDDFCLTKMNIFIDFLKLVRAKELFQEQKAQIESFHHKKIINFLKKTANLDNKNDFLHSQMSLPLLDFLSDTLSKEKLNFYNQEEKESILYYLLRSYLNVQFLSLFHKKGLNIIDLDGLNPYYFAVRNSYSSSTTFVLETLLSLKIPLPKHYWSYIFKRVSYEKQYDCNQFLLNLRDKEFIVDDETKECVWNLVIKHKSYQLIQFIPEEFYQNYTLNGKSLSQEIIVLNDFDFLHHLKFDLNKLIPHTKDIIQLFLSLFQVKENVEKFAIRFLKQIMSVYHLLDKKELKELVFAYQLWSNACHYAQSHPVTVTSHQIVSDLKNFNIIEGNSIDLVKNYQELSSLISCQRYNDHIYKTTKEKILNYLVTINDFNSSSLTQSDIAINEHAETLKKINFVSDYNHVQTYLNDENLIELLNSLEESQLVSIFNCIKDHIASFNFPILNHIDNDCHDLSDIHDLVSKIESDSSNIEIQLFTKESFENFKKEYETSNNSYLKEFLIKHKSYESFQNKSLASASKLLNNLHTLYETFPHFHDVIQHIENLMILQNKGDKSFYIPPLLLGGGPGVGKTFFCHTISKLVNTHFELVNMESLTANFVLTGLSSQWSDATPGRIFKSVFNKEKSNMNPIFLLDELEKSGGDSRYSVMNSLLPLLERYTAKTFKDECIPLPIDTSYIVWIATANDLDKLSAPIKSRFDIFSIPNPTPNQRKSLIKGIYESVRNNNTWGAYFSEKLPEETLNALSNLMAPGAARDLRKSITMACSKAVKENQNILLPSHIELAEQGEVMPWDIVF